MKRTASRVSTRRSKRISSIQSIKQEEIPLTPVLPPTVSPDEPLIKVEYESEQGIVAESVDTTARIERIVHDEFVKKEESDSIPPAEVIPPNVFRPYSKPLLEKQPANWIGIYNEIVRMRALIETPVDRMGCGTMPTSLTNNTDVSDRRVYRFQLLIALMLSSQTKDEVNFAAISTLHEHYRQRGFRGLCLDAVLALTEQEIDKCIAKVGFHTRKAMYIKKACELLRDKFDSDVPKTIEEVVSLPGVGPKMGHLLLQNGWNINLGIGVDVHIHRLAQMWGWVPKSDKPETTRAALEDWLPREVWADINPLLVGFGQSVCAIKANHCDVCTLSNGLCKSANKKLAKLELTEKRIEKLAQLRGNLAGLIELRTQLDKAKTEAID